MLICSSFLISVCMFIVSKALLISSATMIVRAGGANLIEPLCYGGVVPSVPRHCSVLYFVPVQRGCVWYVCCYVRKKALVVVYPLLLTLVSGGSPLIQLMVHQPAYPSIWPAAPLLQQGLPTNPVVTTWCVCGCS